MRFSFLLLTFCFVADCGAHIKSGFCKPYYASIKSNKANSHRGPGREYKIRFEYIMRGTPVMITAKYDHWRLIKDPLGHESWIHKSLLSPKRFVISVGNSPVKLVSDTTETAAVVALIKKNVVMELKEVRGNWCRVSVVHASKKYKGWIKKSDVFGVFEGEIC
ncbi:MAG: hypothetical protein IJT08_02570 [Alphaproteobacteria bacterium]|nr:hypothetical protein [Alphaproteobacteria bacterium]